MKAEPYICTEGTPKGEIRWYQEGCPSKQDPDLGYWQPYADFEREKLKELKNVKAAYCGSNGITVSCQDCYWLLMNRNDCQDKHCGFEWQTLGGDRKGEKQHCHHYGSAALTGYAPSDYDKDSESSRLLKRAEFLKAVCEKEGVEWLPREQGSNPTCGFTGHKKSHCDCAVPTPLPKEKSCSCEHSDKWKCALVCPPCKCYCHKDVSETHSVIGPPPEEWCDGGSRLLACFCNNGETCGNCSASQPPTPKEEGCKHEWKIVFGECFCPKCKEILTMRPLLRDTYTKEEIDRMNESNLKFVRATEKLFNALQAEEKEFRKEILEFLGDIIPPKHQTTRCVECERKIEALRKRFL